MSEKMTDQAPAKADPSSRESPDRRPRSPWPWLPAACALAGVILLIFATHGPPASSSGFVSLVKGLLEPIAPAWVADNPHLAMIPGPGSWLFAFVLGMAAGGFIAGRVAGKRLPAVPRIWRERIGSAPHRRYLATFIGGFLILFGSRLAGGCTLGLFMSGSIQLAVSGLLFGALIFGLGWGFTGYCPGTTWAAAGEGRTDALFALLGGLAGTTTFAALHGTLIPTLYAPSNVGALRLMDAFGGSRAIATVVLVLGFTGAIWLISKLWTDTRAG